jgi:UDP-N-acetylmuramoyl-L-alanyl-D-glutamate--2,6-diaminopimelate ligase
MAITRKEPESIISVASTLRVEVADAGPDDVVVIAGKGHEAEQIVGDVRNPFSDQAIVRTLLDEVHSRA